MTSGSAPAGAGASSSQVLLELFDGELPRVYGYLLNRCHNQAAAEDLTSQTFLAAVDAVRRNDPPPVSLPWLIGVARHKLVDHWRRQSREERGLAEMAGSKPPPEDPWEIRMDVLAARATLDQLGPHHRAALTLRYVDDLPVSEVARLLGRTVHATEALLVRARLAFRRTYEAAPSAGEDASDA